MVELLRAWKRMRRIRRLRRQSRDLLTLLIIAFMCVACQGASMLCGLVFYALQQVGLLPPGTPTPMSP